MNWVLHTIKIVLPVLGIFNVALSFGQEFVAGKIITKEFDTVSCNLVKLKNRKTDRQLNYNEIQVVDSLGQITKFFPEEIGGYIKGGILYYSVTLDSKTIFVRQLVDGQASLYFYESAGGASKYFFKRISEPYLNMLNVPDQTIRKIIGVDGIARPNGGNFIGLYILDKDKAFINYFAAYFKDCPLLVNKIKSEFYTGADMSDIFIEYNKYCSKKGL